MLDNRAWLRMIAVSDWQSGSVAAHETPVILRGCVGEACCYMPICPAKGQPRKVNRGFCFMASDPAWTELAMRNETARTRGIQALHGLGNRRRAGRKAETVGIRSEHLLTVRLSCRLRLHTREQS